jgi:hypothetical protein
MDYLTKWMEEKAIKDSTAESVSKFLLENIICKHGCLTIVQSDLGTNFTSDFFNELNNFLRITQQFSTA